MCADPGSGGHSAAYYFRCLETQKQKSGLDKAPFFLSIHPLSEPDTLYRIFDPIELQAVRRLAFSYGDWARIEAFRRAVIGLLLALDFVPAGDSQKQSYLIQDIREGSRGLLRQGDTRSIQQQLDSLKTYLSLANLQSPMPAFQQLKTTWSDLVRHPARWRTFVPVPAWHGWDNQYTNWLSAVIFHFDFGRNDANRDVSRSIRSLLPRTMLFAGLGILLAFLMAIPLAMWSAANVGKKRERMVATGLFMLDSLPSFWLGLMLLFFLADPEYLGWFPSSWEPNAPFWQQVHSMILPLLVYINGSLAFLTRTLRASILEIQREPFILTARAQGYSQRHILWRHTLRPALLPMITVIGTVFPLLVSGSVILEELFNINGLGYTILKSTLSNERNIVLAVFTLSSLLTLLGYFVSDLLYAWADPRIRFHQLPPSR